MNAPRVFPCALTALALRLSPLATGPEWAARLGLDLWNVPEIERQIDRGREELAEGQAESRRVAERIVARERVVDDLCARRINLREAAARFRDLSAGTDAARYACLCYTGDGDDERYCRQVIQWVHARLAPTSPEEADRTADALEKEFRQCRTAP